MEKIDELIIILQTFIVLGGVVRIIQCAAIIATDSDDGQKYKARIKNIIYFCVISTCVLEIVNLAQKYFTIL